ncbi:caspase domain-containing protein [Streptomyces sp. NPDC048291]|uniref:caspase family protein n=1 Tax=Streptomyces sp. NPDC048291 TaxID=3365530 RepID=UPI003722F5DD
MSDRGPLRDYSRSRAVLIGVSHYRHLPSVPAARTSLERMARLLTGPLCGRPKQRVEVLRDTSERGSLPDQLMTAFGEALDVALFYFVGHGQLHDDELCLALGESPESGSRCTTLGLQFSDVRSALRACDARTKIVILDCCFAGWAARPEASLAFPSRNLIDRTGGTGAFTMAASGAYRTAWYESDPKTSHAQTYFTKYLIDAIERETPGPGESWTLRDHFARTADALARDRLPEPTQSMRHHAGDFVLARGRRPEPARPLRHQAGDFVLAPTPSPQHSQATLTAATGADELALLRALRTFGHERRGYDMAQVDRELPDLVDRMSDPERCLGVRPPYFRQVGFLSNGYRVSAVDAFLHSRRARPPMFAHALRILLSDKDLLLSPEQAAVRDHTELRGRCRVADTEMSLAAVQLRSSLLRRHRDWAMLTDRGMYVRANGSVPFVHYDGIDGLVVSLTTREEWVVTGETGASATYSKAEFQYGARSLRLTESSGSGNTDRFVHGIVETIKKLRIDHPSD